MAIIKSAILFVATLALGGCVTLVRGDAPVLDLSQHAYIAGFAPDVRMSGSDNTEFLARTATTLERLQARSGDDAIDILALSGGGAGGAFGAGAIVGLTQSGKRPEFEIVTGVSTGALIAPFAFLGPEWDDELTEAYTGGMSANIVGRPGLGTMFRVGVFDDTALRQLIDRFVTRELVDAVAREATEGRMLLVATTNLDSEETVIWDLGAIARRGGEPARQLFVNVLVASSSVPGVFPPVMFDVDAASGAYQEMHVDGGTTVPFFIAPHAAFVSDEKLDVLNDVNIYVIINGQLGTLPRATPVSTVPITMRGFSVVLMHMARIELALTASFASQHGMKLKFASIPVAMRYAGSLDFETASMRNLFNFAHACAANDLLWRDMKDALVPASGTDSSETDCGNRALPPEPASQMATE
ncbi:patatin-like phospholipase family protein [Hyphomonas johnsonii]|uniref:Patatin n=1 Tax=Hyphomonas johnsonii MHS-2 TaxID=1280950 RepID=A0A059FCK9_9PROT|nr:patatin-like phospholipase family protein [Hyphomonas johnsonii]KCZ88360.1 patatin [Hyphomonas johnsonii MHS-2]